MLPYFLLFGLAALFGMLWLVGRAFRQSFNSRHRADAVPFYTYLAVFSLGTLIVGYGIIKALQLLQSALPADYRAAQFAIYYRWLSSAPLFLFGSLLTLSAWNYSRRNPFSGWLFVTTLLFLYATVNAIYWYVSEVFFHFRKANGLWKGKSSLSGFTGLVICFLMTLLTVFAYWLTNYFTQKKPLMETKR